MDYLKRFVTCNILSIIGYWVLGLCIYNFIIIVHSIISKLPFPGMALVLGSLMIYVNTVMSLIYFLSAFCCEFLILFILSKILKKQVGLNFKNKVYDIVFRLGICFCTIPITIILALFILLLVLCIMPHDGELTYTSLVALTFAVFDIEIKYIFLKKYFETKTK